MGKTCLKCGNSQWIRYVFFCLMMSSLFVASCQVDSAFSKINAKLTSKNQTIRSEGLKQLRDFKPATLDDQREMLRAATGDYVSDNTGLKSVSAIIIETAAKDADYSLIDLIKEKFDQYDSAAKYEALLYLASIDHIKSLPVYTELFLKHGKEIQAFPAGLLQENYTYRDVIFPKLLSISQESQAYPGVLLLLLDYLKKKQLSASTIEAQLPDLISYSKKQRTTLSKSSEKDKWNDEEISGAHHAGGVVADLLGFFNSPSANIELNEYLKLGDPKLKMFAAVSLLRSGQLVTAETALAIASDAESRNWFFEELLSLGKADIFPTKYRTQAYFAESNMVNWLVYPTELGRIPDSIELMKIIETNIPEANDKGLFFLFRFKSNEEAFRKEGWMAGVSGYFLKKESPTTRAHGYTFSSFEKWNAKTMDQHIADTRKLLSDAFAGQKDGKY